MAEAEERALALKLRSLCGVDVAQLGARTRERAPLPVADENGSPICVPGSGARPDPARVRTYFFSLAKRYRDVGTRHGVQGPLITARKLVRALLAERGDDAAALRLDAELALLLEGPESVPVQGAGKERPAAVAKATPPSRHEQTPLTGAKSRPPPWTAGSEASSRAGGVGAAPRGGGGGAWPPRTPLGPAPWPANTATPDSRSPAARGVLGRTPGSGPRALGARGDVSPGMGSAGYRSSCHPGRATDTEATAAPATAGRKAAGGMSVRAGLRQEIRAWKRDLVRLQAAGDQFSQRAGPEEAWIRRWQDIEQGTRA